MKSLHMPFGSPIALSTADVADLLAARGVMVLPESIRKWMNRFGRHFVDCIRRDRIFSTSKVASSYSISAMPSTAAIPLTAPAIQASCRTPITTNRARE